MLVSLLEQVRTERGTNASRRYRYQRMCLLRCEICGKEQRVQYTKQVRTE